LYDLQLSYPRPVTEMLNVPLNSITTIIRDRAYAFLFDVNDYLRVFSIFVVASTKQSLK